MARGTITARFTKVGGRDSNVALKGYDDFVKGTGGVYASSRTGAYSVRFYGLNFEQLRGLKNLKVTGLTISFTSRDYGSGESGEKNSKFTFRFVKGFSLSNINNCTSITNDKTIAPGKCDDFITNTLTHNDMPELLEAINSDINGFLDGYTENSFGLHLSLLYIYISDIVVAVDYSYTEPITVTTSASPAEGGKVTGSGIYESGTTVTLTAAPNNGYKFSHWLINGVNSGSVNPLSGSLTADTTVTAVFEKTGVNSIYIGTAQPKEIYIGTQKVKGIYIGTQAVYET